METTADGFRIQRIKIGDVSKSSHGLFMIFVSPGTKKRPGKGAFFLTGLNEILRAKGVSHLIVCGVTTEAKNVRVAMGWGIFP